MVSNPVCHEGHEFESFTDQGNKFFNTSHLFVAVKSVQECIMMKPTWDNQSYCNRHELYEITIYTEQDTHLTANHIVTVNDFDMFLLNDTTCFLVIGNIVLPDRL